MAEDRRMTAAQVVDKLIGLRACRRPARVGGLARRRADGRSRSPPRSAPSTENVRPSARASAASA